MGEFALERVKARAKVKRRLRKPRGPRSPGPWWPSALWLVTVVVAYVRAGIERDTFLAVLYGVAAIVELHSGQRRLAWWRWERQEGIPHPPADRWDRFFAAWALLLLVSHVAWLAGVR
jgi:hypothetical protein